MGASNSKREVSSLYDDGSWIPPPRYPSREERFKVYDHTERAPTDISGPLGPRSLYNDAIPAYSYRDPYMHAPVPVSEKTKPTLRTKVFEAVGRAGTAGLGKAVDALDTIGSSMTNLNKGAGFTSAGAVKANKIGILAFEVANTIAKGYGLKESLSKRNIKVLKEEVLHSYGVQRLVSTDMTELLNIVVVDKIKELALFAKEVVRFGNQCRDPQWHNLDRYFDKIHTERSIPRQNRDEVEQELQCLVIWAQQTGELYHELDSLEKFEAEVRHKLQDEETYDNYSRGDNFSAVRNELKAKRKAVKLLQKKSLWSKTMEEVMEKLVDAVYFLHSEVHWAFGDTGMARYEKSLAMEKEKSERLGPLGLALHYACIIGQIDGLVSRPSSVPVDTRDNLYQSLPPGIKAALRHEIPGYKMGRKLSMANIQKELDKTLSWLLPMASNTSRAHHGFGWVGEWANTGSSLDVSLSAQTQFSLVQTLHHADRNSTEQCILELLVLLHYMVYLAQDNVVDFRSSIRTSPQKLQQPMPLDLSSTITSSEDNSTPHLLDNQEASLPDLQTNPEPKGPPSLDESMLVLTKSNSRSSGGSLEDNSSISSASQVPSGPVLDFKLDRVKSLDVMDRVDDI